MAVSDQTDVTVAMLLDGVADYEDRVRITRQWLVHHGTEFTPVYDSWGNFVAVMFDDKYLDLYDGVLHDVH